MSTSLKADSPAILPIKVFTTLDGFHPDSSTNLKQGQRWNNLVEEFSKRYGRLPTHIARAPGRVNLIGEHIDYCYFGVLPTAIEPDILIACAASTDPASTTINVQNLDPKYGPKSFGATQEDGSTSWTISIDQSNHGWENYVKAAYHGVLGRFFSTQSGGAPRGADFLFTGSVPSGSGVSSSSAMVVCSSIAFSCVNDKIGDINQGDLVELCIESERRVGVHGGGMDQSTSVFSTPSSALYISFYPKLAVSQVPIPRTSPPTVFVIANSLVTSDKVVTAKTNYNLRVVETMVAARILAKGLGVEVSPEERVRLGEVLDRWIGGLKPVEGEEHQDSAISRLKDGLERIIPEAERILGGDAGERGLTQSEMIAASGLDESAFQSVYGPLLSVVEATYFQLYKRTIHVFTEALRVLQFREISINAAKATVIPPITTRQALARQVPKAIPDEEAINAAQVELGALMDASQKSCDELFDCSAPELNDLINICKDAGALGSRLTGAGWGGCTVSLVKEADVESFIQKLGNTYPRYKDLSPEALKDVIFATKPASGAGVYKLTDDQGIIN